MARHFETIRDAFLENMTGKQYKLIKSKWGISKEVAKEAGIFYIPPSPDRDVCIKALLQAGLSPEEIVATGMTTDKLDKDGAEKDLFTGRMVFPVKDEDDEDILRLCGRDWPPDDTSRSGSEPVKWMNSKGEIKCLANEAAIKKAKAKPKGQRRVGVAEGKPNALAAKSRVMNVCGPLGKENFKPEFAKRFDGLDGVFIFPDNDADGGGLKAARNWGQNLAPVLRPQNIQMVVLPDEDGTVNDLADYLLKHAVQDVSALCAEAPNLLDFELGLAAENPDPNVTFEERFDRVATLLSFLEDGSVTEYCRKKVQAAFPDFRVKQEIEDLKRLVKSARKNRQRHAADSELITSYGGKDGKRKVRIVYEAREIDGLVDIIPDGGDFGYLLVAQAEDETNETGKTLWVPYIEEVEDDDTAVQTRPPQHNPDLEKLPFVYAELHSVEKAVKEKLYLHQDFRNMVVVEYYDLLVDLPQEQDWGTFLFCWAAHTWVQEYINHTPFLLTYGEEQKGKSRTCRATVNISYRGYSTPSITEASFFRMKTYFGGAVFLNSVDIKKEADAKEVTAVLHSAYERGDVVFRMTDSKRAAHRNYGVFDIFGPVLISTNWDLQATLESRCVLLPLVDSGREPDNDFEFDVPDMVPVARDIKSIFTAMRAAVLSGELVLAKVRRPTSGRLGEALRPIYMMLMTLCPEREQAFLDLVESIRSKKLKQRVNSVEGLILAAVREAVDGGHLSHGFVPLQTVIDTMDAVIPIEKREKEGWKSGTVVSRLKRLGFEVTREICEDENKQRVIWVVRQHLNNLLRKYGLDKLSDDDDGPPDAGAVPPHDKPPDGNGPPDAGAVPPHDSAVKNPPDEDEQETEVAQRYLESFNLKDTANDFRAN